MAKNDDEQGSAPEPEPTQKEQVSVDLTDLDDDDDGASGGKETQTTTAESRKGRRTQFREARDRASAAEERATSYERQLAEVRGQLAALQRQPVYVQQQPQQQTDPIDGEIESVWQHQQLLLRSIQNPNTSQEEVDRASAQWRALDKRRMGLLVRQAVGDRPQAGVSEDTVVNQMLQAEFPEVLGNDAMRMRAMAEMTDMLGRGRPRSIATAREACERVLSSQGLRKRTPPAPSASQQAKYTSVPSRAGTNGSANGHYVPSQSELRTARAYTEHLPDLSDEERVRRWVRDVARPAGLIK